MPYISLADQGFYQPFQSINSGMSNLSSMIMPGGIKDQLALQKQQEQMQNASMQQKLKEQLGTANTNPFDGIGNNTPSPSFGGGVPAIFPSTQSTNTPPSAQNTQTDSNVPTAPIASPPPSPSFSPPQGHPFSGPLTGKENDVAISAYTHGVDPKLMGGIAAEETGFGSSNALKNFNNPGGLMQPSNPNKFQAFQNVGQGLDAMATNLKKNYIDQGLTTPDQIGAKYSPPGASNDPNGTNGGWPDDVKRLMANTSVPDVRRATAVSDDPSVPPLKEDDSAFKDGLNSGVRVPSNPPNSVFTQQQESAVKPPKSVVSAGLPDVPLPSGNSYNPFQATENYSKKPNAVRAGFAVTVPADLMSDAAKALVDPTLANVVSKGLSSASDYFFKPFNNPAATSSPSAQQPAQNSGNQLQNTNSETTGATQNAPPKTTKTLDKAKTQEVPSEATPPQATTGQTQEEPAPVVPPVTNYPPRMPVSQPIPDQPPQRVGESELFRNLPSGTQQQLANKFGSFPIAMAAHDNAVRMKYNDATLGFPMAPAQLGQQITQGPNGEIQKVENSPSPMLMMQYVRQLGIQPGSSAVSPDGRGYYAPKSPLTPWDMDYHPFPEDQQPSGHGLTQGQFKAVTDFSKKLGESDAGKEFTMAKAYWQDAHENIEERPQGINTNDHQADAELLDSFSNVNKPTQALRMGNVHLTMEGQSLSQWLQLKQAQFTSSQGASLTPNERQSLMKIIDQTMKAKANAYTGLAKQELGKAGAIAQQYGNVPVDGDYIKTLMTGFPSGDPTQSWKSETNDKGQPTSNPQADQAKAWLQANPNDPRAGAVRAKLQQLNGI